MNNTFITPELLHFPSNKPFSFQLDGATQRRHLGLTWPEFWWVCCADFSKTASLLALPDLTVCDYFLCGFFKQNVSAKCPRLITKLNNNVHIRIYFFSDAGPWHRRFTTQIMQCKHRNSGHLRVSFSKQEHLCAYFTNEDVYGCSESVCNIFIINAVSVSLYSKNPFYTTPCIVV